MEKRNHSIDLFRYVCAIMIVAIHTRPFADVTVVLGELFTRIIPRIAVPFFFAVSGYFYVQKLEKGQKVFVKYIKRLLITYSIWSCVYYIIDFLRLNHSNMKDFALDCIYGFVITGSHYHFWFFPAIIFSVCITTLLFKSGLQKLLIPGSIILYIIGCMGCSYYGIGVDIPILKELFESAHFNSIRRICLMGFPFFISGYLVYKIKDKTGLINMICTQNPGHIFMN